MIAAKLHKAEDQRIKELHNLRLLDSEAEKDFDEIVELASVICDCPIALVSLIDEHRQWFKARKGLEPQETPREQAFCAYAIHQEELFEVNDSRTDERFMHNPLVTGDPHVIFYAGIPLITSSGMPLGTLCTIDNKPKKLSTQQAAGLKSLANQVMSLIELRKHKMQLEQEVTSLNQDLSALDNYNVSTAHDLKTPLTNISGMAQLLQMQYASDLPKGAKTVVNTIVQASSRMGLMIDQLLDKSRESGVEKSLIRKKQFYELISGLMELHKSNLPHSYQIFWKAEGILFHPIALSQALTNLISNSIKYCNKSDLQMTFIVTDSGESTRITVQDNGVGVPADKHENIFDKHVRLERDSEKSGTGLGLAMVKNIVHQNGGTITTDPMYHSGLSIVIEVPKPA